MAGREWQSMWERCGVWVGVWCVPVVAVVLVRGKKLCCFAGICIVFFADDVSKDHTTMTAPLPVCSAKLSIVGPG
jgi:hypothetical protein